MDITHNLTIKASPETIFKAISTDQGIKAWWAKAGTVGETEGASSVLQFNKEGNIVEMGFRTLSLIPNEKVVWECVENPNPTWLGTKIITEITPSDGRSKVVFAHTGFDEKSNLANRMASKQSSF